MLRIRRVEEAIAARYPEQHMRCPTHLCIGQEAIAAGLCTLLAREEMVFSNHRSHGHYLAKGGNLKRLIAELYGKSTGCAGGRGGSMHLIDREAGFMGATPIVGGTVPLAVGAAWGASLLGIPPLTTVFFGDGCFEEGVLHEAMNFAVLHRLPVLFVCENNGYAVYTPLRERQPQRPIAGIARAHGLAAVQGDGNRLEEVMRVAKIAILAARQGEGPQFLELFTHRWPEHCGPGDDDHLGYRPAGELAAWKERCPIQRATRILTQEGILTEEQRRTMEATIREEIQEAMTEAQNAPDPDPATAGHHVYA